MIRERDFLMSLDAYLSAPYTDREAAEDAARAREDGPGYTTCQGCSCLFSVDDMSCPLCRESVAA